MLRIYSYPFVVDCPTGFVQYGSRCFILINRKKTRSEAKAFCEAINWWSGSGQLLRPDGDESFLVFFNGLSIQLGFFCNLQMKRFVIRFSYKI